MTLESSTDDFPYIRTRRMREQRWLLDSGPASALGPNRDDVAVQWFVDRFAGRPATDRFRYVDATGRTSDRTPAFADPTATAPGAR